MTSIVQSNAAGTTLLTYAYTYDPGSRLTSQTINGVTTNYKYDAIDEFTADGTNTYSYNANESRTNPGYIIGANNELLSDGTWNYTYDAEGNQIQKVNIATGETWTFSYNNANQETSATDRNKRAVLLSQSTFTFDVFGNRVTQAIFTRQSGQTTVTNFAFDDAQATLPNIWADLSATHILQTRRIFGDGMDEPLIRIQASGTVAWYLTDHLGSIVALVNNNGKLTDQITYDVFGNVTGETHPGAGDRFKYVGMQFDSVQGEYNTPGREYNPTTGGWNGQDAMGVSGTNGNLYPYLGNDPVNGTDPSGLHALWPFSGFGCYHNNGSFNRYQDGQSIIGGQQNFGTTKVPGFYERAYQAKSPNGAVTVRVRAGFRADQGGLQTPQPGILINVDSPNAQTAKDIRFVQFHKLLLHVYWCLVIPGLDCPTVAQPGQPSLSQEYISGIVKAGNEAHQLGKWYVDSPNPKSPSYVSSPNSGGVAGNTSWMFDAPSSPFAALQYGHDKFFGKNADIAPPVIMKGIMAASTYVIVRGTPIYRIDWMSVATYDRNDTWSSGVTWTMYAYGTNQWGSTPAESQYGLLKGYPAKDRVWTTAP